VKVADTFLVGLLTFALGFAFVSFGISDECRRK